MYGPDVSIFQVGKRYLAVLLVFELIEVWISRLVADRISVQKNTAAHGL